MEIKKVEFSRPNKSVPWGFSIQGGREFGCPLSVLRVTAGSIANQLGVMAGDFIVKINGVSTDTLTHQQAILQIQTLQVMLEIKMSQDTTATTSETLPPPPPSVIDVQSFNNSCRVSPPSVPNPPLKKSTPLPHSTFVAPPPSTFVAPPPSTFVAPPSKTPQPSYTPVSKVSQPTTTPKPKDITPYERSSDSSNKYVPQVTLDANKVDLFCQKMNENNNKSVNAAASLSNFLQNQSNTQGRDSKDLVIQQTNLDKTNAICYVCKDHIKGSYIEANKKVYCSEHFCCSYCGNTIKGSQFIETKEGTLYCLEDFRNNIAPKCAQCSKPVLEEQIMALGKCWHSACFLCDHCKRPIQQGHFHVKEDNGVMSVYCEKDYKEFYELKCTGCNFPIEGDDKYLLVSGKNFHVTCYKK